MEVLQPFQESLTVWKYFGLDKMAQYKMLIGMKEVIGDVLN